MQTVYKQKITGMTQNEMAVRRRELFTGEESEGMKTKANNKELCTRHRENEGC